MSAHHQPPHECFPEPDEPDFGRASHAADRIEWLRRSGVGRAVALRRFMNENLSALPHACALSLCRRFEKKWDKAAWFEMLVGRFLQLAGATVEYEPAGVGGLHVDFLAEFASATAFVEAVSPDYNRLGENRARYAEPLLDILNEEAPRGWWVLVHELPAQGPDDRRRVFRHAVRGMFADVPAEAATSDGLDMGVTLPNGRVAVTLRPGRPEHADPIGMSPGPALIENDRERITTAVRGKRAQARAFHDQGPVLLALDAAWHTDIGDFDTAVFGGSYATLGPDGKLGDTRFRPTGIFGRQKAAEFAAALVFPELGFVHARDPLLYMHPLYGGDLPPELDFLERRSMTAQGIRVASATGAPLLERLSLVSEADWAQM